MSENLNEPVTFPSGKDLEELIAGKQKERYESLEAEIRAKYLNEDFYKKFIESFASKPNAPVVLEIKAEDLKDNISPLGSDFYKKVLDILTEKFKSSKFFVYSGYHRIRVNVGESEQTFDIDDGWKPSEKGAALIFIYPYDWDQAQRNSAQKDYDYEQEEYRRTHEPSGLTRVLS